MSTTRYSICGYPTIVDRLPPGFKSLGAGDQHCALHKRLISLARGDTVANITTIKALSFLKLPTESLTQFAGEIKKLSNEEKIELAKGVAEMQGNTLVDAAGKPI